MSGRIIEYVLLSIFRRFYFISYLIIPECLDINIETDKKQALGNENIFSF